MRCSVVVSPATQPRLLTALNVAIATGIMYFTPNQDWLIPGWAFLAFFRFFVDFGNAGMIAVDIPPVQEFVPTYTISSTSF